MGDPLDLAGHLSVWGVARERGGAGRWEHRFPRTSL